MTPDQLNSPDPNVPNEATRTRPAARLRAALAGVTARGDRQHRVPPKMRSIQLGVAVAAVGVLGVVTGAGSAPTDQPAVQAAAHAKPLAARPVPPASAPVKQDAPQAAPAPQATPEAAAAPAPEQPPAPQPEAAPAAEVKPKDQIGAWIDEAITVLEANGVPREKCDAEAIRTIIMHESNGDPTATNNWDSNAAAGTPSIGLMQTIEPTFESFALPGHGDIYNPVDNIIAATRYAIARYGSVSDVPGVVGVTSGGSYQGY
ncbi:transglycosylase SLT domain-containing protein [Saccharopolyspora thermophila]|uniref:transglycosylase SLT domain-containing protein n=1 Tax=Saccharopolyspora thermophila TaxID=89367 RepID=UPI001E4D3EDA|nr:transglycosylase SLT domain-containing protein [Saccharopolyspora subtropica]